PVGAGCPITSETHRGIESDMAITRDRADGQIVLLGEWTGKNVGTARANSCSCRYVPPIVFLAVDTALSDVCRDYIGRNTPFPSITPLDISGTTERDCRMH